MHAGWRSIVIGLAPLVSTLSGFPQTAVLSSNPTAQVDEGYVRLTGESTTVALPRFNICGYLADYDATAAPGARECAMFDTHPILATNPSSEDSSSRPPVERSQTPAKVKSPDSNRSIFYRNRLEFSLEGGWLPVNIPFPLDVFVGDVYNTYPLKYTLVPILASLRWHIDSVKGPIILRGNFDMTFTGSVTFIPRGPETRYFAYIMGLRRNFVPRNWKVTPYFDIRLGVGNIDAKGPEGVPYAQGENLTFTVQMGSGVRYNFSPRYALSGGLQFMHISNLDLSEGNGKPSWGIRNYGINVYGPMVGLEIQLRRHKHADQLR